MVEIIPAIMPQSREAIESTVERYMETPVQTIQLDLMDGNFVPAKTWPYKGSSQYAEYQLLQKEGFPGWQDIDIELDLMIFDPLLDLEKFIECGPSRVIVHADSVSSEDFKNFLEKHSGVQTFIHFGIAFTIHDSIEDFAELHSLVDFVQCMGIEAVGVQGSVLDPKVFELIKKVQTVFPGIPISVDGGVNPENAQELIDAGVERLVSGSFLSQAIDVKEAIELLGGKEEDSI